MYENGTKRATTVLRWLARFWSLVSMLFVLAFVIGEGLAPISITPIEWVQLLLLPFGVIVGLMIAWRREGLGGGLAVLSLVTFYALHYIVSGDLPKGPYFGLVAAPGLLFLLCGLLASRRHVQVG
jgi:hypothetical protein